MLTAEDRIANLTGTIGNPDNVKRIRELLALHEWKFASTMPGVPHEYSLKWKWRKDEFNEVLRFIWDNGVDAWFGTKAHNARRYWFDHESGWYYFIDPSDLDAEGQTTKTCALINRGQIENYVFWVEDDLLEKKVKCRVNYQKLKSKEQTF